MNLRVIDMPDDAELRRYVARLCVEQWRGDFPHDTEEWYLTLYDNAKSSSSVPIVLVAMEGEKFVGTASLIEDDELPDATEPGPWLAAVYVIESYRNCGIGRTLVQAMMDRASSLGRIPVFLYTESGRPWYESMGWEAVRVSTLANHDVTVMRWS